MVIIFEAYFLKFSLYFFLLDFGFSFLIMVNEIVDCYIIAISVLEFSYFSLFDSFASTNLIIHFLYGF